MPEESLPMTASSRPKERRSKKKSSSSRRNSTEAEQRDSRPQESFRRPDDGLRAPCGTASSTSPESRRRRSSTSNSRSRSHLRSSSPGLTSPQVPTRSNLSHNSNNKDAALALMEKELAGKSVRQTMSNTSNTSKPKSTQEEEELPSAAAAAMRNRQQDLEAKRYAAAGGRGAVRPGAVVVAGPGAADATATAPTNSASNEEAFLSCMEHDARSKKMAAKGGGSGVTMRPGAVALSNTSHSAQDEQAMLLAGMPDDAIKKRVVKGGSTAAAATKPGAVAVAGCGNEQAVLGAMSDDAINKCAAGGNAPSAVAAAGPGAASSNEQALLGAISDDAIKKSAARGNAPAAVAPGAVAVAGPGGGGDEKLVALSGMAADDAAKKRAGRRRKSQKNVTPGAVAVGGVNSNDGDDNDEVPHEEGPSVVRDEWLVAPGAPLRRQSRMSFYNKAGKEEERPDHLRKLMRHKRASIRYMDQVIDHQGSSMAPPASFVLDDKTKEKIIADAGYLKAAEEYDKQDMAYFPENRPRMEVRLNNFSYVVKANKSEKKIKTVYNQSVVYHFGKWLKRVKKGEKREDLGTQKVLDGINLILKPGKMYLLLGPPTSGKTSLLRAIAGRLSLKNGEKCEGNISYNGLSLKDNKLALGGTLIEKNDLHIENAISYVEQLDHHAPRLSVKETFDFAFQCRSGGTHARARKIPSDEARVWIKAIDKGKLRVHLVMEALGLDHVADTFVGDNDIRGVSGGQRRRVTVGEMMQVSTPIFCGDEISTGLDAASTFDMVNLFMQYTRISKMTRIISLLQPSPEAVSLFDEVILLSGGKLLYAGPLEKVEDYFAALGYIAPEFMDVADFLQTLSTSDGAKLFNPPDGKRSEPYTMSELAEAFRTSDYGTRISLDLRNPWRYGWASRRFSLEAEEVKGSGTHIDMSFLETKYINGFWRSFWLNMKRFFVIWTRDKRFLVTNAVKNAIMGVSVGGVFFNTDDVVSIFGVLFQAMLFIMLGAMVAAPAQVTDRSIYYRHADSNFYPAFPYVFGRAISVLPQAITDVLLFGTILYWMVGLAATASNYFIFIAVLFVFTVVMNQMLSIFAAIAPTESVVHGLGAVVLLFSVLFGGFIVSPDVIPNYYSWIYWWNPMAWAYRALVLNEFWSDDYDEPVTLPDGETITESERVLKSQGFVHKGEPFPKEWIGYAFAYLCPYILLCVTFTALCLILVRVTAAETPTVNEEEIEPETESGSDAGNDVAVEEEEEEVDLAFTPVTLSFEDICYDVHASKGKETLRLLNNVNGYFASGRMCALMGSSGAGKTTLMDVIALRKSSGTITGDVRLNGFEQEPKSFRRCSGYVEQFDVQSPELTVRETVLFSARLRLDSKDPAVASDEAKARFVDAVLKTLELTPLADCEVGSNETGGGLSFEQNKRLSIAVELAASPSIIFLDEPTSGLDARAAFIVVQSLRRIADSGRTVIATIHQPSSAVFSMFDDLLLLKKGGRVVFFGELGEDCQNLVDYFESLGTEPIGRGENPANWMLKVMGGGVSDSNETDFAKEYEESDGAAETLAKLNEFKESPDPNMEVKFESEFAAPAKTRRKLLSQRLETIYWRSPAYNLSRMMLSALIGFIMGSVFLSNRRPEVSSETDMNAVFGVIFISFIITGVLCITSVLPVMLKIRDAFYRQQAAGMADYTSLALALGVGEKWFILLQSFFFCVIFLSCMGISGSVGAAIAFWGYFTFNIAIYSYFGQCFMCCVRSMATAQILASVFIGINNFFSGYIVRPQFLEGIFQFSAWITPGSYVYEGMIICLFQNDNRTVVANPGSDFYESLGCNVTVDAQEDVCSGSVMDYVQVFFGGEYPFENRRLYRNAGILGGFLVAARFATFLALKHFRFTSS